MKEANDDITEAAKQVREEVSYNGWKIERDGKKSNLLILLIFILSSKCNFGGNSFLESERQKSAYFGVLGLSA